VSSARFATILLAAPFVAVPLAGGSTAARPPAPTITSAPPNPSYSSSATFTFSDANPLVTFRCRIDGRPFSICLSPITYSGLADGKRRFDVKAVDLALQESEVTSYTWKIDTKSPVVTLTDKPPAITNQTTANFSFVSNKSGSTYRCSLDGAGLSNCTSPRVYAGLGDGSHTFAVQATANGATGPKTQYTWIVDTVAPNTAITSAPPASSSSGSAAFAFAGTESGSTFVCSLDAGGIAPCASPARYAGLGDGNHSFRVQAVDRAGNADRTPAAYAWRISGIGPSRTDTTPPGNVRRLTRSVGYRVLRLAWNRPPDADFDHVEVYVSTKAQVPPRTLVYKGTAPRYTKKRFKNGLYYRYAVLSYDHAGNASRGKPVVVPPSILLRSPRNGVVVKTAPRLSWARVPGATYYNVQLYYKRLKVLSAWPAVAKLGMSRRWVYGGRRFQLKRGLYEWYVWPGFGPRSKARYGQLLGQGTFRVG
jgi:hypothetical protein